MRLHVYLALSFVVLAGVRCTPTRPGIAVVRSGSTDQYFSMFVGRAVSAEADEAGREVVEAMLRDEGFELSTFEWDSSGWIGESWQEVFGTVEVSDGEVTQPRLFWVFGNPIVVACTGEVLNSGKWAAMKSFFEDKPDQFWWELLLVPPTTRSAVEREFSFRSTDGAQHAEMYFPGLLIAEAMVAGPHGEERRVSVPLTIELAGGKKRCTGSSTMTTP